MIYQCPKCGLSKSNGVMNSVLPQCKCDWGAPAAQRPWVGLTDEEIDEWTPEIHAVIRAVEAKLKEKNNG